MNYELNQVYWRPREDDQLFFTWTHMLPIPAGAWPKGLGPHSIDPLRMILQLRPIHCLLEIGLNLGHSSALWLNLGVDHVVSVDISNHLIVTSAGMTLEQAFPERFQFLIVPDDQRDNQIRGVGRVFDAIFIDGSHEHKDVSRDIELARSLGIRTMIFDDHNPHWGPGVQPAIAEARLKTLAVFGNIALCEDPNPEFYSYDQP